MNTTRHLKHLAIQAHRRGQRWTDFWNERADAVRAAVPYDRQRRHRLVCRLLGLVVAGDANGQTAVGDDDAPWVRDDQPMQIVDATRTAARCQLSSLPMQEAARPAPGG
jgi:hypothetical protein